MHRKEFKVSVLFLLAAIFSVLMGGMFLFSWVEGWPLLDALYFVTATATTIGYGDFTPTHDLSKIFTIIYALSIVPFVLYVFSLVAQAETERVYHKLNEMERKQKEQEMELAKTEQKLADQRRQIKEQEGEIENQEKKLKEQIKINQKQEVELDVQEKELGVVEQMVGASAKTKRKRKK